MKHYRSFARLIFIATETPYKWSIYMLRVVTPLMSNLEITYNDINWL